MSLSVCWYVCLLATLRKTSEQICMKFSGKVGSGSMNKRLNFGAEPGHRSGSSLIMPQLNLNQFCIFNLLVPAKLLLPEYN